MARQRPRARWGKDSIPASVVQLALIAFIVLKLAGVITWSWWWVLSPLWIGGLLLALGVCAAVIGLRRQASKQTRLWADQLGSEWFREFVAGKTDPDTPTGGRGHGRTPPS
jgi:Transmembrane Fragile-X-F protein